MTNENTPSLKDLLGEDNIDLPASAEAQMNAYMALLEEWNDFASLLSVRDIALIASEHIPDALSLAGLIRSAVGNEGVYLDIGSGGGLPAIPIKLVLPDLRLVMVERSAKKVGFLRKAFGVLGIEGVTLLHGEFPHILRQQAYDLPMPRVITARAVEKPDKMLQSICKYMGIDDVFLCQSREPARGITAGFHVEHVQDDWSQTALRRSELYRITAPD
jgi:16S rRNA (guanine(527)-N(7))-methyltransferase RsmG